MTNDVLCEGEESSGYLDFSKTFDNVSNDILIGKFKKGLRRAICPQKLV